MIQQLQKQDYEKFARHMHENEKESADLWKTCNASMRQYVDSAAEGMKAVADSNRISEELLREDKKMIEDFEYPSDRRTALGLWKQCRYPGT